MKKFLLIVCMIAMGVANLFALERVYLSVGTNYIDPIPAGSGPARMPPVSPCVSIDDHTLYFLNVDCDLTLVLLDEDGDEAYTMLIPAGTTSVVLPSSLSGDYELQLYPGSSYYFYSVITL